jgi:lysophospholipase L1-like esterase
MPGIMPPGLPRGVNGKGRVANTRFFGLPKLNSRKVMATPPTVTTSTAATNMTSPFFRPAASGNGSYNLGVVPTDCFTYTRGTVNPAFTGTGVGFGNVTVSNTPSYGAASFGVSFMHDGATLELVLGGNGNSYLMKVDGEYVTLTPKTVAASGTQWDQYAFGSTARRRIDIIGYNIAFNGVNIGGTDSLDPAPVRGPRCIILGDSFTAIQPNGFTTCFADAMGWDDVWASGVGGTGYLATNGGAAPTFRQRVQNDVISYAPEVVIIPGSVNDDGLTAAAVGAEAALLYAQLKAALPNALICAAPTAKGGVNAWNANKLAIKAALKAAAQAAGVLWLDLLEMPISFTGAQPASTVYQAASAAATSINVLGTAAKAGYPQPGGTIEIGSGATLERINVKTAVFGGSFNAGANYYFTLTFDGALQYAHAAGETWTQVGSPLWTGHGKVGSTIGYGNSDLYVLADGTHPTDAGGTAIGQALAELFIAATGPN